MKKKYKIFILIGISAILFFGTGLTYSVFHSGSTLETNDQKIASFIFETQKLDHLEFSLTGLTPGTEEYYNFQVSNNSTNNVSDVAVQYEMIIKTYHFIPLTIELYSTNNDSETLILTCDETFSRNSDNELVCNSPIQEMDYNTEVIDDYKLKITFPEEYSSEIYASLVDYIDIEIKSYQKTKE